MLTFNHSAAKSGLARQLSDKRKLDNHFSWKAGLHLPPLAVEMKNRAGAGADIEFARVLQRLMEISLGFGDRPLKREPFHKNAATADASVQPVPCVFLVAIRGAE